MEELKIVSGNTEEEIWQQVKNDLANQNAILEYKAVLEQNGKQVLFNIDVDPGGGFEGGFTTTAFLAPLTNAANFQLAIHRERLLDEAGKLFGMQDVVIGYPEFDKKVIIKTNNETKIKDVFADAEIRNVIGKLNDFSLKTISRSGFEKANDEGVYLELIIENEVPEAVELQKIYHAFIALLTVIEREQ
jgi:hypothetical protein